jgi:hypothetical protein
MDNLRAALEQLDEALDRLEDAVAALPAAPQTTPTTTDPDRAEIARRLDQVIVDVQGFLDLGLDRAA